MHQPLVDSHEATRGRKSSSVARRSNGLVHSTRRQQQDEYAKRNRENSNGRLHANALSTEEYHVTRATLRSGLSGADLPRHPGNRNPNSRERASNRTSNRDQKSTRALQNTNELPFSGPMTVADPQS